MSKGGIKVFSGHTIPLTKQIRGGINSITHENMTSITVLYLRIRFIRHCKLVL